MNNKRACIGGALVTLVVFGLCVISFDAGCRQRLQDTDRIIMLDTGHQPTSLMVSIMILSLNSSEYNQVWHEVGYDYLDISENSLRSPTVHDNSFIVMVSVCWILDNDMVLLDNQTPHADILVEVLPFEYVWHDYAIERVAICGGNLTGSKKIINLYTGDSGCWMCTTDWVSLAFFGYGSWNSDIMFWVLQNIILTVGPVWYFEKV